MSAVVIRSSRNGRSSIVATSASATPTATSSSDPNARSAPSVDRIRQSSQTDPSEPANSRARSDSPTRTNPASCSSAETGSFSARTAESRSRGQSTTALREWCTESTFDRVRCVVPTDAEIGALAGTNVAQFPRRARQGTKNATDPFVVAVANCVPGP